MANLGNLSKIIAILAVLTQATLQLAGCTTVVGKGTVAKYLVGECTEGEDCASYCCVKKEGLKVWGSQCGLKSPATEGTPCVCPVTTILGLNYMPGTVCSGTSNNNSSRNKYSKPLVRDYKSIDYKKWTSGLYNDEFVGKAVIVEGYIQKQVLTSGLFGRPSSEISLYVFQYSHDQIRRASINGSKNTHNKTNDMIRSMIPVSAPKSMRDQIYSLNDQDKVKIYGVVINPSALNSGIRVKAESIETLK
jgi:hypothetical protein